MAGANFPTLFLIIRLLRVHWTCLDLTSVVGSDVGESKTFDCGVDVGVLTLTTIFRICVQKFGLSFFYSGLNLSLSALCTLIGLSVLRLIGDCLGISSECLLLGPDSRLQNNTCGFPHKICQLCLFVRCVSKDFQFGPRGKFWAAARKVSSHQQSQNHQNRLFDTALQHYSQYHTVGERDSQQCINFHSSLFTLHSSISDHSFNCKMDFLRSLNLHELPEQQTKINEKISSALEANPDIRVSEWHDTKETPQPGLIFKLSLLVCMQYLLHQHSSVWILYM